MKTPYTLLKELKFHLGPDRTIANAIGVTERQIRNYRSGYTPIPVPVRRLIECLLERIEASAD